MYILKNAITNLKRNKGRNILMGTIIIVISCALTIALAIKNTSDELITSYEEASEITATISFNRTNMMEKFNPENEENMDSMKEEFNNISSITSTDIEDYANSTYVKSYYYTSSLNVNSDIEAVSSDFSFGGKANNDTRKEMNDDLLNADFTLTGYSSIEAMQEFINGSYTLSDYDEDIWTNIIAGDYCLINYELATLNKIQINDKITIIDPNDSDNVYSLTVIGIFTENSTDNSEMSLFSNSANTIITNTSVTESLANTNDDLILNVTPYFILTALTDAPDFESELYEKGLNENYQVTTNESEIESATSSISNVATFAMTFLVLTLIIGAVVLFIINSINIRERKYEIGVLRTIGMKKSLLATQFMLELVMVTFVGLLLGAIVGAYLSKPISNSLLSSEINKSTENVWNITANFGGKKVSEKEEKTPKMDNINFENIGGIAKVEAFNSINAVVDFKVLIELIGVGILLTLISSLASIINIIRFKPLNILKERSS